MGSEAERVDEEARLLSAQVSEVTDLVLLLEKDERWTEDVRSIDSRLIEEWLQYLGELVDTKKMIPRTSIDFVEPGREFVSANDDLKLGLC